VENAPDPFTAVADFFAKGVYNKPVVIDGEMKTKLQVSRSRPRVEEGFPPGQSAAVGGRARSQPVIRDAVVFDNSPPQNLSFTELDSNNPFAATPDAKNPFEADRNPFASSDSTNPFASEPVDDEKNPFQRKPIPLGATLCHRVPSSLYLS